jgi:hypothetical protein
MQSRILIFLIILNLKCYCQKIVEKSYIIITFEKTINKFPQHGIRRYYKIIETDSIKERDLRFKYFIIGGYSNNDFKVCQEGGEINPYLMTSGTNFSFEKKYLQERENLLNIIEKKRKFVQTISKKWSNDLTEKTNVFFTPVQGLFCDCIFKSDENHEVYFKDRILIPYSGFKYDDINLNNAKLKRP